MITLSVDRRLDWARMIDNLRKLGMSQQDIADSLQVGRSSVQDYSDRQMEPKFWIGSRLIVLWAERTGLPWTDAPTHVITPSVSRVLRESA